MHWETASPECTASSECTASTASPECPECAGGPRAGAGPRGRGDSEAGGGSEGGGGLTDTAGVFVMYTHAPEFFARETRAAPYGASPQEGGVDWVRDARWACPPADRRQQRSDVRRPGGACGTDVAPSRVALEVKGPTSGGRHQSWMALWVQVTRPPRVV